MWSRQTGGTTRSARVCMIILSPCYEPFGMGYRGRSAQARETVEAFNESPSQRVNFSDHPQRC